VRTLVAEVLAAWRRAERLATELPEESRERLAAVIAAERLHALYRDLEKVAGEVSEADARALLDELAAAQSRQPDTGEDSARQRVEH
jgi:ABC-type nitrate/sulfonate/bicarbonate transport system substrate-binding protein